MGQVLKSVKIKIAPDGEFLVKGPNVMMGYYKNETATNAVFDDDGWFLTGDIGEYTPEGYLVKMIKLLSEEWTVESGELTPTMKLKRKVIAEKYKDIIESFFD
ncbi:MAG: AMP-binding protein [Bacteroidetes bacterium]|nr:AMP-binding protein [Bacteroidota bacterium]